MQFNMLVQIDIIEYKSVITASKYMKSNSLQKLLLTLLLCIEMEFTKLHGPRLLSLKQTLIFLISISKI